MGMFDYFYSSFDLGEEFTSVQCQTKDFEPDLGGTLSQYWLAPSKALYIVDYSGTHDIHKIEPNDPEYDDTRVLGRYTWKPNGRRGRVSFCMRTMDVNVYPAVSQRDSEQMPIMRLHFLEGMLETYCKTPI